MVERVHESVIALGIKHEEALIEQHIDRLPPGTLDHELGAGLTKDRRRLVDELSGIGLYAKVDAALRIGRRRVFCDRNEFSAVLFRHQRTVF
ncbi:MAG TPA: hypothetical protein VFC56_00220 [Stellaceae bacterium]|nr:hypothetical protein [Stellaceae bacterium]